MNTNHKYVNALITVLLVLSTSEPLLQPGTNTGASNEVGCLLCSDISSVELPQDEGSCLRNVMCVCVCVCK